MNIYAKAKGEQMIVEITGAIGGYDWENDRMNTAARVQEEIAKIEATDAKEIIVRINSFGGYVSDGLAIFEALREKRERVTTEIIGHCASAATIIALGGERRKMSKYALFLVHRAWCLAEGNANDMSATLEELQTTDATLLSIYADITGKDRAAIEELMDCNNGNGKWLTAEEAKEWGFVDEITDGVRPMNDNGRGRLVAMSLPPLPEGYMCEGNEVIVPISPKSNDKHKEAMNINEQYAMVGEIVATADVANNGDVTLSAAQMAQIEEALQAKVHELGEQKAEVERLSGELEASKAEAEEVKATLATAEEKKAEAEAKVVEMAEQLEKLAANDDRAQASAEDPKDEPQDSWSKYLAENKERIEAYKDRI